MFLYGCNRSALYGTGEKPGFGEGPYIFDRSGEERVIVAKNDKVWFFDGLCIGNRDIFVHNDSDSSVTFHRYEPAPHSDSKFGHVYKIENEWFIIQKIDNKRIKITIDSNKTGTIRRVQFRIMAGNPRETIYIEQKAE